MLEVTTVALTASCGGSLNGSSGGSGSAGFSGGSLDGGGGFGGGAGEPGGTTGDGGSCCTTTFSGAFSLTIGCIVNIGDAGWNINQFSIGFIGGPLVGTPYSWSLNVILPGKPRTATFDLSSALAGTDDVVSLPYSDPPVLGGPRWSAWIGSDGGPIVGSLTLTLTSVGQPTSHGAFYTYASPHGTATVTMVDTVQGMPDLNETVVF